MWDSRTDDEHYIRQEWQPRQWLGPGSPHHIQSCPVAESEQDITSTFAYQMGIVKNFVMAMDREGRGFTVNQQKFPRISLEKLKAGIHLFIGALYEKVGSLM